MAADPQAGVPELDRAGLIADDSLGGRGFCAAYTSAVDNWLAELFRVAAGSRPGVSVVAIGGFGRRALCPRSDLDVMLLHRDDWDDGELEEVASALWAPIWNAHIDLGHSVRTVSQTMELAATDLDTATSLLSLRHIAGDQVLSNELAGRAVRSWRKGRARWLPVLVEATHERSAANGELAYLLEPDLKYSGGGLRDIDTIRWIEAADIVVNKNERGDVAEAEEKMLAARVQLHRNLGRKGDRLRLEEQDAVAAGLGYRDADIMMSEIAAAARTVDWIAGNVFQRAQRRLRRFRWGAERPRRVAEHIVSVDEVISITPTAPVIDDRTLTLRLAVAAAENEARIDRDSLDALVAWAPAVPVPWPNEIRDLFVELLLTGYKAIPVIETLDHVGLFTRLLPEWEPTRSKVQRNQYHRYTVDRHLLETAAVATELIDRVKRPDLLVVGALLHDIGKGYPGDHTDVGVVLIGDIATNMGFDSRDVATLKRMCEHHLLLPDVATRRDLDDPGTIADVAAKVRTPRFLRLLEALTEADSIATGPSAWSKWKAQLVDELVRAAETLLRTGEPAVDGSSFPNAEQAELLAGADHLVSGDGHTLTVIAADRPGLFARVAGAVALSFLNVIEAHTYVDDDKVLEVIRVDHPDGEDEMIDWRPVIDLVAEVIADDQDLTPRFAARAASRLYREPVAPTSVVPIKVEFDNEMSAISTVIEVGGPDRLGLLYELSTVLSQSGLDMQQIRVQTIGGDVVDAFYVQTLEGTKLTDPDAMADLRERLLATLTEHGAQDRAGDPTGR